MTTNLFGTDGIRNSIGSAPFTMQQLPALGMAIGAWACQKYGNNPTIVLAHDTRESVSFVKAALQTGLLLHAVTVYDAQMLPSPAVVHLTQKQSLFNCGIIISASHNPYFDNGIKIVDAANAKITHEDEQIISSLFISNVHILPQYQTLGSLSYWQQGNHQYQEYVKQFFTPQFLHGKKIVIDCAHGALSILAPAIFNHFGATLTVINNQPNGKNINEHCGALYPGPLQNTVVDHQADVGFAFDGDGDRVIAVNNKGIIKDGDDILALLLAHPRFSNAPALVATDMSNQGFEQHVHSLHKILLRTPVGDKYIVQKLEQEELMLGGEQSGHIIMRDYLNTGDGLFTALRVMEAIMQAHNDTMETFNKFPQIFINVPVTVKKDLSQPALAHLVQNSYAQIAPGRLIVRYSGTEPVLRIMLEHPEKKYAEHIGQQLSQAIKSELSRT